MEVVRDLRSWFLLTLAPTRFSHTVKAYVADVMAHPERVDMSKRSIIVAHVDAVSFIDHQRIGDWALWSGTFAPRQEHLTVIQAVGQTSYSVCYRLLGRKIHVFEELADELPVIVEHVNRATYGASTEIHYSC